jgi:hypothetical protein
MFKKQDKTYLLKAVQGNCKIAARSNLFADTEYFQKVDVVFLYPTEAKMVLGVQIVLMIRNFRWIEC